MRLVVHFTIMATSLSISLIVPTTALADTNCDNVRSQHGVMAYLDCVKVKSGGSTESQPSDAAREIPNLMESPVPLSPKLAAAVSAAGTAVEFGSTVAQCAAIYERSYGLITTARAFERLESKFLGPLGAMLTAVQANNLRNQGQTIEANQLLAGSGLDLVVCHANKGVCASWMVGKTLGTMISEGPKFIGITERSVNEWWTDQIVGLMHPDPTEADFRRFEAEAKRKIKEMRVEAQAGLSCMK